MKTKHLIATILCMVISPSGAQTNSPSGAKTNSPGTNIYWSTGDHLFLYEWMPIDSEATAAASLDILKKKANINRIFWQGATEDRFVQYYLLRPGGYLLPDLYKWCVYVMKENKLSQVVEKAARARGIAFWAWIQMFDSGNQAVVDSASTGEAYVAEDRFRAENPQYCVYDRAGITYSGGMMEYGYPEVRKEFAGRFEEMFRNNPTTYDGVLFSTYVENFSSRFTDEYIYSDIAVADFQKRYGIDVRTQPFDLDKYYALRGEYITQYLCELRPIFKKYHKKLVVQLNSKNPNYPQRWESRKDPDILGTGKIKMDWRLWAKEDLVDELAIPLGGSPKIINYVLEGLKGTSVTVNVCRNEELAEDLVKQGVIRSLDNIPSMDGYLPEMEGIERPVSDIDSPDSDAVLNVLCQARMGKVIIPTEKIVSLLSHSNPIFRRQAIVALAALKRKEAVPALEKATLDSENNVRCMAVDALGKVHGPQSLTAITTALAKYPFFQLRYAALNALIAMRQEDPSHFGDIITSAFEQSRSPYVRSVLVESTLAIPGEFFPLLKKAMVDPDADVRLMATIATCKLLGGEKREQTAEMLLNALDDSSCAVQNAAALALAPKRDGLDGLAVLSKPLRERLFTKLMSRFQEYGVGCNRPDRDWGYRVVGEVIAKGFGIKGRNELTLQRKVTSDTSSHSTQDQTFFA